MGAAQHVSCGCLLTFRLGLCWPCPSHPHRLVTYGLKHPQSSKKDTSGTAKAVVASLNGLGLPFDVPQIELVRDPEQQVCPRALAGAT
jgi:hypothetical protein